MSSRAYTRRASEPERETLDPLTCPIGGGACAEACAWRMHLPEGARACAVAVLAQGAASYDAGAPCEPGEGADE